ncbi:MAG: hypothetical protein AAF467_09915 [Actinomycetota bacterium]
MEDQYRTREFIEGIDGKRSLLFLDVGRNHGLVFYYTMYRMMRARSSIREVTYIGIDPSPLKFVYFNFFSYLEKSGTKVTYRILDRAVTFGNEDTTVLKYGERNFGNFNVVSSNYSQKLSAQQGRFEFVEIEVDAMSPGEILALLDGQSHDVVVAKIDCKNRTEVLFDLFAQKLEEMDVQYLVAAEADGSVGKVLDPYRDVSSNTLSKSNVSLG